MLWIYRGLLHNEGKGTGVLLGGGILLFIQKALGLIPSVMEGRINYRHNQVLGNGTQRYEEKECSYLHFSTGT